MDSSSFFIFPLPESQGRETGLFLEELAESRLVGKSVAVGDLFYIRVRAFQPFFGIGTDEFGQQEMSRMPCCFLDDAREVSGGYVKPIRIEGEIAVRSVMFDREFLEEAEYFIRPFEVGSGQVVLLLTIGYFFIRRQRMLQAPILPVDLLKIPIFSLSVGTSVCSFTAQMLAMVSLPFLFQDVLARSVAETGLLLTPWPLATIVAAPLAGRLVEKIHPGLLGGVGMAVFALGLFLLVELPPQPENSQIIWRMAVCGAGFGLFQTPNNVTIISSAPTSRSGGASGMQGTARLFGQTLGTTLVALIFRVTAPEVSPLRCLMVAIGFALTAAVVSSLRLSQATPVKKRG